MPLEVLSDSSRQRPAGGFDEFSPYPPIADSAGVRPAHQGLVVAELDADR